MIQIVNFWAHVTWKFDGRHKKNNRAPPLYYVKLCASFQNHRRIQTGVIVRKCSIWVKWWFFVPCDLKIWQMTLKNNRAHLLSYFKLCASFHRHLSIQNGATIRKRQICVKSGDFFVPCDLWNLTVDLENNRTPLLCSFKLCVSFHSLLWNQNKVAVWKHQIWGKSGDFLSRVTLKFDRWPWKTIGHLFYATSSLVLHFIAICEFKMESQSGNAQFGSKLTIFCPVWPWNLMDDLEKQ